MKINFRPFRPEDAFPCFQVFFRAVFELEQRQGMTPVGGGDAEEALQNLWGRRESIFQHVTDTAEQCWVAEDEGKIVGYARAILRDGVRQLTEYFVHPTYQSAGVGHGLISRTFPKKGADYRIIIATTDLRAQARYMKERVFPRFPIFHFSRMPEEITVPYAIVAEPVTASPEVFDLLNEIDKQVLGFQRPKDHAWLLKNRRGYIYVSDGDAVGYGYLGPNSGPFALLESKSYPAVLAHAEHDAALHQHKLGLEVPSINTPAIDYLMARGFQIDAFMTFFMSNSVFGNFENYIFTNPPFFA